MATVKKSVFEKGNWLRCLIGSAALVFAAGIANAYTTDPVTGCRILRFTPDSEEFTSFKTTWQNNAGYYFKDGDVYEFEESNDPYVFPRTNSQGNHPRITFRGVKADGSPADPAKVVLQSDSADANYRFEGGSVSNVFENLTFSNMPIFIRSDYNTVSNCIFTGMKKNSAIYGQYAVNNNYICPGWSCSAMDCRFENALWEGPGAARLLYCFAATNCVFYGNFNNTTGLNGGGAIAGVGNLSCYNCSFTGNYTSGAFGGAINLSNAGTIALDRCSLTGNYVACVLEDNLLNRTSSIGGGAISISEAVTGCVHNCLFTGNYITIAKSKNVYGGAIRLFSSGAVISVENCTFAGNTIAVEGTNQDNGGAIGVHTGTVGVTNCIFYANHGMLGTTSWRTSHLSVPDWSLVANCLEANFEEGGTTYDFSSIDTGAAPTTHIVNGVNGNKVGNYDPKFTDASNGDYTLQKGSPCRDAGALLAWMDSSSLDLAGTARVFGDHPDIGCYEWWQKLMGLSIFVR